MKHICDRAREKMYLRTMVRQYVASGICPWCGEDLKKEIGAISGTEVKCPSGCDINNIEGVE